MYNKKAKILEGFETTKKTVLDYSENLLEKKVDASLIFRNAEYVRPDKGRI